MSVTSGFWSSETLRSRLPDRIDPYDDSRIVNCAYELGLGRQVFITGSGLNTRRILVGDEQVSIPAGQFAHLVTQETVDIPNDALGLISMKTTYKLGGLINVSGFHIDPGFKGRLVFSVYNAGPNAICLTHETPVFLLWIASLDQETEDTYVGSRASDEGITADDVNRLQGDVASPQALASRVSTLERRLSWQRDAFVALGGAIGGGLLVLAFQAIGNGAGG